MNNSITLTSVKKAIKEAINNKTAVLNEYIELKAVKFNNVTYIEIFIEKENDTFFKVSESKKIFNEIKEQSERLLLNDNTPINSKALKNTNIKLMLKAYTKAGNKHQMQSFINKVNSIVECVDFNIWAMNKLRTNKNWFNHILLS